MFERSNGMHKSAYCKLIKCLVWWLKHLTKFIKKNEYFFSVNWGKSWQIINWDSK